MLQVLILDLLGLRPVTYRWDRRTWYGTDEEPFGTPDGSKKRTKKHIRILAQEALEVEKAKWLWFIK